MAQAEIAHLERSTSRRGARVFTTLFALALGISLLIGLGLGLMARSGSMTSVNLRDNYLFFRSLLYNVNIVLVLLLAGGHGVLVWETLLAAADAIAREKRAGAWETLVLTRLTGWQIVAGKWWGVQAFVYRRLTWLLALRAIAFLWLVISADQPFLGVAALIAAFALPLALAALNMALAAAIGLVASFSSSIVPPVAVALSGYVSAALVYAGFHLLLFQPLLLPGVRSGDWEGFAASALLVTPLDGGVLLATHLGAFNSADYLPALLRILPVSPALYAALIGVSLLAARRYAIRHSAAG